MIEYNLTPVFSYPCDGGFVNSFIKETEGNIDRETVKSFGDEWEKFNSFDELDLITIGKDYFDLVDITALHQYEVLDVGCGSGRWAKFLSPHVKFIEAIDPSQAIFNAFSTLQSLSNIRFSQAGVDNIPFSDESFDLVYSLGVLHHLPNTYEAIHKCSQKIKKGGFFLLYLYYKLENRGFIIRLIFGIVNFFRKIISRLPSKPKLFICECIALFIYLPLALFSRLISNFSEGLANKFPLSYYRKTSFYIMRNDALDRFGTPLEKRFSKAEIEAMLVKCGFTNIVFSDKKPYWHVISQRN